MTSEQLEVIHARGPADMAVTRVTYVVNGTCFAWLAEVSGRRESNFLAGSGLLPQDAICEDALAAVILGICARLRALEAGDSRS